MNRITAQTTCILATAIINFHCSDAFMAKRFNKMAAEEESKAARIISELHITKGMSIADIGAGGGYFTFLFSRATGKNGIVYAVDVNKTFLELIKDEAKKQNIKNIRTVLTQGGNSNLTDSSVELVFLRNVYHHLPDHVTYFKSLKAKLKKGGRVAIVEYIKKGFNFVSLFGHSTDEKKIIKDMISAGFIVDSQIKILEKQSFIVFIIK